MRKVLYILGELSEGDLGWLLDAGRPERIAAGTTIIREGQPLDRFFIVLEGEFSVTVAALRGREVARLGSGEVVGDMSMLDSRPPNATVTAHSDAIVFAVPQETLRTHLRRESAFAARFYRALCIFLANRLNRATLMAGGGGAGGELADPDELSADVLENVSLAGTRFDWFLKQVRGKA